MRYAIIMAAGKGTRMKSLLPDKSKVSYEILGVPLVGYVLRALAPLGIGRIVTVLGFGGESAVKAVEGKSEIVWQHEPKGTAHAVMQAAPLLEGKKGSTLIVCGDTPLLKSETLSALFAAHEKNHDQLTVLGSRLMDPFGYGRLVLSPEGELIRIVEEKDATKEEKKIATVNTGVMIFDNELLFRHLSEVKAENKAGEYYLTDLIALFKKHGYQIGSMLIEGDEEMLGANDRVQLAQAAALMKKRINERHTLAGVTIEDPANTYIGPDVTIEPDTEILPGTHLLGRCQVGKRNIIGPYSYLKDCVIRDGNVIEMSHLCEISLGSDNAIGPFARLRPGTIIDDHVRVGNFMEVKNSRLHEGVKAAHLSYLGDAEIYEKTNVGCGTIIANYDGVNKFHTTIGRNVFVGSGSTLISPLTVEDDSFIAAGSTITRDVKKDDLAIARAQQVNKAGYSKIIHRRAEALAKLSKKKD